MAFLFSFGRPARPRKATRQSLREQRKPGYRWWRHAGALAAISGATITVCVLNLHNVTPVQFLVLPLTFLLALFGEYWLHRVPFHNPRVPDFTYYEHTGKHHAFFSFERMQVDDLNDLRFVMFAVWVVPLMIIGTMPVFGALYVVAGSNCAWLYLMGVMIYYSMYEFTHALAHLPVDRGLGSLQLVQALSYHHRVHHDPRLMRRYNFAFAIPIFDYVFGTKYLAPSRDSAAAQHVHGVVR